MQIFIDNKLAVLKKEISFDFVFENRLFSGSDGYTLNISFPLKDCNDNVAIFGHLNRADVVAHKVIFNCEIRDGDFCRFGLLTVTDISDIEVKAQFLEGRSEQNFDRTLDKYYINELKLGSPANVSKSDVTPSQAWNPDQSILEAVALPWVNDYSGNIQNKAEWVVDSASQNEGHFEWSTETSGLSWQPYLIFITKKIIEAINYTADLTEWENKEEYRYILICNTLPYAWYMPEYANALPHWTVEEYFQKLELFLNGEFDFDHRAQHINFRFTKNILSEKDPVNIDKVIEEYSTKVSVKETSCQYLGSKNLVYKDCDHVMWKYYSCDWFIKEWANRIIRYNYLAELISENRWLLTWNGSNQPDSNRDKILYAADCDAYFIVRTIDRRVLGFNFKLGKLVFEYKCRLQPVNLFGGRIVNDSDNAEQLEIEFVPAWVDDTEEKYGRLLFLSFASFDDNTSSGEDEDLYYFKRSIAEYTLSAGENEKKAEYYDRIYVGYWNGSQYNGEKLPYPFVEDIEIAEDWSNFILRGFSLRLNNRFSTNEKIMYSIDSKMKTTFKFLADKIPDVRAVFFIRGRKYLCEKITAIFTDDGMSQLMKGEFYPIAD